MPNSTTQINLVGYALRPFVQHLALASRLVTPSSNKLITSMNASHCSQSRFLLDFRSDEGKANAQGWYKRQGRNTRFTLLEYRKDKRGQVKHEFIVVWLNSTTLCRFDRRARDDKRGHVLKEDGAPADDSAHVLSSFETEYRELLEQTEVLLTVKLPQGEDLGVILAVCAGIQTHAKASAYSLLQYNCYFFAWMIVAAVARRTYNWETNAISKEGWDNILRTSLAQVFEPESPRRTGLKSKLSRVFTRSRTKTQSGTNLPGTPANAERFRYELLSQYSDSYRAIERILPKLLLRSQLGSVLKKELSRIESEGISSVKRVIAKDRALDRALEFAGRKLAPQEKATNGLQWDEVNLYLRTQLLRAAEGAAKSLIDPPSYGSDSNPSWKDAWNSEWNASPQAKDLLRVHDRILLESEDIVLFARSLGREAVEPDSLARKVAEEREAIGEKGMSKWKGAWDECERLGAQYATAVTETVLSTILERLQDMVPDQLVFGSILEHNGDHVQPENELSLQGFIRRRMQGHFEMAERFGFGSFEELTTTTEEVMCEIWVTSLDIIEASWFYPQVATNGGTSAQASLGSSLAAHTDH